MSLIKNAKKKNKNNERQHSRNVEYIVVAIGHSLSEVMTDEYEYEVYNDEYDRVYGFAHVLQHDYRSEKLKREIGRRSERKKSEKKKKNHAIRQEKHILTRYKFRVKDDMPIITMKKYDSSKVSVTNSQYLNRKENNGKKRAKCGKNGASLIAIAFDTSCNNLHERILRACFANTDLSACR